MNTLHLPTVEALPDKIFLPDMEWFEGGNVLPIRKCPGPHRLTPPADHNLISSLPLVHSSPAGISEEFAYLLALGVETGGKEVESLMLEGETPASLVDSTLAQQHMLLPSSQGLAYHLPLLVCTCCLLHAPFLSPNFPMSK